MARIVAFDLTRHLNGGRVSSQMLAALWTAMGDLLTTEASRRRVWLEIGRTAAGEADEAEGLLYDSREAPPEVDLADPESLRAGLLAAYGDSTWVDIDRLIEEISDPETPPSEARRCYLNQIVAAEDAWITGRLRRRGPPRTRRPRRARLRRLPLPTTRPRCVWSVPLAGA